jgi:hypothetical protein
LQYIDAYSTLSTVLIFILKGTVSRDFWLLVFHESVSPQPQSILLGQLQFISKFAEIFASQGAPPVSMTPVAKLPLISTTPAANLPLVSTTTAANFATSFARVVDTGGKFATGVHDTGGKFAIMSTTPIAKQRSPNKIIKTFMIEDFFPFATSVNDTGGAP